MKILVTGAAGFIGFHLSLKLAKLGFEVIGIDSINDYYDVQLKYERLKQAGISSIRKDLESSQSVIYRNYKFFKINLEAKDDIGQLFESEKFDVVINLAAQAGVRYSLENPYAYAESNLVGFLNILEGCRSNKVKQLIYASSSSVYGLNSSLPFFEEQSTEHPVSLYAATKKANEMMAHSYSHLYNLPTTALRFFTVYGPWGRPDMAMFLFTKAILEGKPIKVFNNGDMLRDFTYVEDVVESISRLINKPASADRTWSSIAPKTDTSSAPYRVFNIGNSNPIKLMDYIEALEDALGIKAIKHMLPIQPGDVLATHANTEKLVSAIDYKPKTSVKDGVKKFVDWYLAFYINTSKKVNA
ncbi:NAD-dependent epimerase [Pontibacter sp. FD36]|uniref:NAD-dependent epimerase n=1 Tax=Pontibacter sp. FD36 TaxID=2789860 RepID=UPI0018ABB9B1|nr:NAD-dependent epimerase [Pontibacter sp. FD36]MBF8964222.1 NAD-dependent epimerase [Pontibacter sp. FD36]